MARTLYDVLGVTVTATPDELRQAYRDRARQLHPDRVRARGGRDTDAIGAAMREVNEAWRVLRDPAARLAYDRTLLPSPGPDDELDELDRPFRGRPAEPGDVVVTLVRALPWVLVLLVLGGIFVFTAFAGGGGSPSDRQVVGDCVRASATLLEVVPCTGPEVDQVVAVTRTPAECPTSTVATPSGRDRVLCLRPFAEASP